MVASTNHLNQLDPGLSSRPSRFDRKYLFPNPLEEERTLYCQYWRAKLKAKHVEIEFPEEICPAAAAITEGFSFAYMQEAFVATLLVIAQKRTDSFDVEGMKETIKEESRDDDEEDDDKDLDDYELWRELKKTVKALRNDMDDNDTPGKPNITDEEDAFARAFALEKEVQAPPPTDGVDPSALPGQDQETAPLRTAETESSKRHDDAYQVQGRTLRVDHQKVPIITDENTFMYH